MDSINQILNLKKEIMTRLIEAFLSDDFENNVQKIPYVMRPKNCEVPFRCCIHKERAVIRDRIIAGLGFSIEEDDEITLLSEYARRATSRKEPDREILTVLQDACKGCVPSRVHVTDLCQGCVARPCKGSCKFGAISIVNGRSVIDPAKCKNCGMCIQACPYSAITRIVVPCENACPVDAIRKDESGHAKINFEEKCISCAKCLSRCPFGAIHEKSQMIDILSRIKEGRKVVAMLAPAVVGQFSEPVGKVKTAMIKAGFKDVVEVAHGADITTRLEAKDFIERMERGDSFMTTSCCAAWNELVRKHIPEIKKFVSDTHTPLYYSAEIEKQKDPECVTVFVSPCATKRKEGLDNKNVDYVMNVQELNSLFEAMKINIANCEEASFEIESSKQGRSFPLTTGVANAVKEALEISGHGGAINPYVISGINKQNIRDLKKFAKDGACASGNLIEIMSCEGGCVGGPSTFCMPRNAVKQIKAYVDKGSDIELDK
ncbi:MAG: monomeric [FeFe] hydrogenase [bacterium]|nr:monomeric [FeFe] hydrogenase [bacterium]